MKHQQLLTAAGVGLLIALTAIVFPTATLAHQQVYTHSHHCNSHTDIGNTIKKQSGTSAVQFLW